MRRMSAVLGVLVASCATHYVRRAPEPEGASFLARQSIREGMTVTDVMKAALDVRGVAQDVVLEARKGCEPATRIAVGSGPWPRNFALISTYSAGTKSLRTRGYDRQRDFLQGLASGEGSMQGCEGAVLSFSTAIEGGWGNEAIDLVLGADGRVASVGTVRDRSSRME